MMTIRNKRSINYPINFKTTFANAITSNNTYYIHYEHVFIYRNSCRKKEGTYYSITLHTLLCVYNLYNIIGYVFSLHFVHFYIPAEIKCNYNCLPECS